MQTTTLGRTGLEVSTVGLGCGGHSRLGTAYGKDFDHAVGIVRQALDAGITLIDTATNYRTEPHVGAAVNAHGRSSVVVSSKAGVRENDQLLTGPQYLQKLDDSLERLGFDYVDLYHLHGLRLPDYDYALHEIVPALQHAKQLGKLRAIAVSEFFIGDPSHQTLTRALEDDAFDVMMVGFNFLNPSARHSIFPHTQRLDIGTLGMFAVRRALTNPEALRQLLQGLIDEGKINPDHLDEPDPLGFLGDITDAGYRVCAHEPGLDVTLFGTGNPDHLKTNLQSLQAPPLPDAPQTRLQVLFNHIDSVSGN